MTSHPRTKEAREVFRHFDRDGNGTMEVREFVALMRALGALGPPDELRAGLLAVDADGDGHITFDEFAGWWLER
jgi:calcium-binding protein CML